MVHMKDVKALNEDHTVLSPLVFVSGSHISVPLRVYVQVAITVTYSKVSFHFQNMTVCVQGRACFDHTDSPSNSSGNSEPLLFTFSLYITVTTLGLFHLQRALTVYRFFLKITAAKRG